MPTRPAQDQRQEIEVLVRSRYPLIYVVSWEETRVLAMLADLGRRLGKKMFEWSCSEGLLPHHAPEEMVRDASPLLREPVAALREVASREEKSLFVFKDLHAFLGRDNPQVVRTLRDMAYRLKTTYKTLFILAPTLVLPPDLEKDVTVIDFRLPTRVELGNMLDGVAREVKNNRKLKIDIAGEAREDILRAAQGLTLSEAENVFARSLVAQGKLDRSQIPSIVAEKRQIIRKTGLLDYCEPDVNMLDVGGLDALKNWLSKRGAAFSDRARDFGLPPPRGVLLLGVQGCGKSMCAKAVSAMWNLPLLRFDIGRIFNAYIGGSEENIRRAIGIAEGVAPCVLWVDEIDKAFGGMGGNSTADAGVSQRVLGSFLTWLAEKDSATFVVATANAIRHLPPELLRKGRLDEIFFVDLPGAADRANILAIHLRRRDRDPRCFNLDEVAAATEGFSGAELEQVVISGLFDAFSEEGRDVTTDDLLRAARETSPLSRILSDEIAALRDWCVARARPAATGA